MLNLDQHAINDDELESVSGGRKAGNTAEIKRTKYCPYCNKSQEYREEGSNRIYCIVCNNQIQDV